MLYKCPSLSVSVNPKTQILDWHLEPGDGFTNLNPLPLGTGFHLYSHDTVMCVLTSLLPQKQVMVQAMVLCSRAGEKIKDCGKVVLPLHRISNWVAETVGRNIYEARKKGRSLLRAYEILHGKPFVRYASGAEAAGLEKALFQYELTHKEAWKAPEESETSITEDAQRIIGILEGCTSGEDISEVLVGELPWGQDVYRLLINEEILRLGTQELWERLTLLTAEAGVPFDEIFPDSIERDCAEIRLGIASKLAGTMLEEIEEDLRNRVEMD